MSVTVAGQFAQHPPDMSVPPPNLSVPPPDIFRNTALVLPHPYPHQYQSRFQGPIPLHNRFGNNAQNANQNMRPFGQRPSLPPILLDPDYDGRKLRKTTMRKTVDYNAPVVRSLQNRVWQRDFRDRRWLQPDPCYVPDMLPPPCYEENPINAVTTRFVKAATNKLKCPVFCLVWTPEGRRLVTGTSSGEFTLWNGLTFNFETILQAHDSPVRSMVWSHNDCWMVTADHAGFIKYWQSNMNNVKMFQAHKDAIRGITFSPNDNKFATCSDDGTVRIWDFLTGFEERVLRGHGADVRCVDWHPRKSLLISGSKDNQQPIKLWDPRSGQSVATIHAHKATVMDIKWNRNGNWVVTASRDHLLKLFDVRNMHTEAQIFRGHKKEASILAWHPHHEGLLASGGSDGSLLFWHVGVDKEVAAIEQAHDSIIWALAWHPLGHILSSGSNDHTTKYWTRNYPGDKMKDKYNFNATLTAAQLPNATSATLKDNTIDMRKILVLPGMEPDDKVDLKNFDVDLDSINIPGLDLDGFDDRSASKRKKIPHSKPIPKNFQAQWNDPREAAVPIPSTTDEDVERLEAEGLLTTVFSMLPGTINVDQLNPESLQIYGRNIPITAGSDLDSAVKSAQEGIYEFVKSGKVMELLYIVPQTQDDSFLQHMYNQDRDENYEDYEENRNSGINRDSFRSNNRFEGRSDEMPHRNFRNRHAGPPRGNHQDYYEDGYEGQGEGRRQGRSGRQGRDYEGQMDDNDSYYDAENEYNLPPSAYQRNTPQFRGGPASLNRHAGGGFRGNMGERPNMGQHMGEYPNWNGEEDGREELMDDRVNHFGRGRGLPWRGGPPPPLMRRGNLLPRNRNHEAGPPPVRGVTKRGGVKKKHGGNRGPRR